MASIFKDVDILQYILEVGISGSMAILDASDLVHLSMVSRRFSSAAPGKLSLIERVARHSLVVRCYISPCRELLPGETWVWILHLAQVAMAHVCKSLPLMCSEIERVSKRRAVAHVVSFGEVNRQLFEEHIPKICAQLQEPEPKNVDLPVIVSAVDGLVRHLCLLAQKPKPNLALYQRWALELANYLGEAGDFHAAVELLRAFIPATDRRVIGDLVEVDTRWQLPPILQLSASSLSGGCEQIWPGFPFADLFLLPSMPPPPFLAAFNLLLRFTSP